MTTYLLDVNLLIALSDPNHMHHDTAHQWFNKIGHVSWATCPVTENGFIRIISNPRYPNSPDEVTIVLSMLHKLCTLKGHQFWSANLSIREILQPEAMITHNQITDLYLLGLAIANNGKLATLDSRIPAQIIKGGKSALEIVPY